MVMWQRLISRTKTSVIGGSCDELRKGGLSQISGVDGSSGVAANFPPVRGNLLILSAIAERLKPVTHRPSIPIRGAAGIRNMAAISPAEVGRHEHSLPFAHRSTSSVATQSL